MNKLRNFILLNLGCILVAIPCTFLYSRTNTPAGGMLGLALIIYNFFQFAGDKNNIISIIAMSLNVPLIAGAYTIFGLEYVVKVIYASFACPMYIMVINSIFGAFIQTLYPNIVLTILLGGLLQGLGVALAIYSGANTGGTDIMGQILTHYVPQLSVGTSIGLFNLLIMGLSLFVLGASNTLYGVCLIFVVSFVINKTLKMLNSK
jgi:uncharacterized membrane-anchored protein YitT (DUF2179 family)